MQYSACLGMCQVWSLGLHSLPFDNRKGVCGGGGAKMVVVECMSSKLQLCIWVFPLPVQITMSIYNSLGKYIEVLGLKSH